MSRASVRGFLCLLVLFMGLTATADRLDKEVFYLYGQQFTLYRPESSIGKEKPLPLLVLFHGCKMTASEMVELSDIKKQALKNKFMVLTPDQSRHLNYDNCWNWFSAGNQEKNGLGELYVLKQALAWSLSRYPVDEDKVFVAGFSSGAAMATNFFYCHPDSFAGLFSHSGVAFAAADNVSTAETALLKGSTKTAKQLAKSAYECAKPQASELSRKKLIIFQGEQDTRVTAKNATQMAEQFLGFWDFADDDKWNKSVTVTSSTKSIRNKEFPAQVTRFQIGTEARLDLVEVSRLAHRWSGGSDQNPYGEPASVSATDYLVDNFFSSSK